MFLKTMGVLSAIQLRVRGFVLGGFVHGAFILVGFCLYPVQTRDDKVKLQTKNLVPETFMPISITYVISTCSL